MRSWGWVLVLSACALGASASDFSGKLTALGGIEDVKGLGSALCWMTKRLIAACRSTTDRKMPRSNRRFVSLAKKPSTALSQDADVGVKWKVQRGCRANHWRTFGCLWVA